MVWVGGRGADQRRHQILVPGSALPLTDAPNCWLSRQSLFLVTFVNRNVRREIFDSLCLGGFLKLRLKIHGSWGTLTRLSQAPGKWVQDSLLRRNIHQPWLNSRPLTETRNTSVWGSGWGGGGDAERVFAYLKYSHFYKSMFSSSTYTYKACFVQCPSSASNIQAV